MDEKLSKLIIENSSIIETSNELLCKIDEEFINALHEHTFGYLKNQKGFTTDLFNDEVSFYKRGKQWKSENGDLLARFSFSCDGDKSSDWTWMSVISGEATNTVAGFYFWIDTRNIPKDRRWVKKFFNDNFKVFADKGFQLREDGASILCSVTIKLSDIANSYPEFDCFDDIDNAIDKIIHNIQLFNNLIDNLKEELKI